MTCMCDLNYLNIFMIIYLHVLYNYIGINIMHSICTGALQSDMSECVRWFIERVVLEG